MKILIIRFSSIGDIVLTTPVIRCVHQQLNAEVHVLCKSAFSVLLEHNPYVTQTHVFKNNLSELLGQLREIHFDHIIDLHHNLRSWRIKRALGVPGSAFNKLNIEKWLLVNFKVNQLPDIHLVDRYFAAVKHLGVQNDGQGLDYFPGPSLKKQTDWLKLTNPVYISFAIGAAHATKRLPNERIIAICRQLTYPVVLLGGSADRENGRQIAAAAGARVQNLCGQLSLHESAAVIRDSQLVITHDTGMMHIAAAFQKPVISIWGNTVPAFGMYPYYGNHVNRNVSIEVSGLSCRPCSKIGHEKCPKGHFRCMRAIEISKVVEEVNKKMNK